MDPPAPPSFPQHFICFVDDSAGHSLRGIQPSKQWAHINAVHIKPKLTEELTDDTNEENQSLARITQSSKFSKIKYTLCITYSFIR